MERNSALGRLRPRDFRAVNYPEGSEMTPICPITQLIDICRQFAGLKEFNPKEFCGHELENKTYSEGVFHWPKTADYIPRATCKIVEATLRAQFNFVMEEHPQPDENEYRNKINATKSMLEMRPITSEYGELSRAFQKREAIIKKWREKVFEICCIGEDAEDNPHFSKTKKKDDLTEEVIIEKVGQFLKVLEEVTGTPKISDPYPLEAKNCNQTPRYKYRSSF